MFGMIGATMLLAMREIRRHLMRSFLTTLGIIIGVAAVITMVTLGRGLTASVQEDIAGLGADNFIIFPIQVDGVWRPFKDADVTAVERQVPGIEFAAGAVSSGVLSVHNGQNWETTVQGSDMEFFSAQSIDLVEGRGFNEREEAIGEAVCIVGPKVIEEIFVEGEVIGEEMRVGTVSCRVIGTTADRSNAPGGGNDANDVIFMPLKTVQRRFTGSDDVQFFVVKYDNAYSPLSIQSQLVSLLRERRVLQDGEDNDFNIIDTGEINDTVNEVTGVMTAVVSAIAAISLLVGGIGIMNIMLVSVTERTREIGIRLAIGARAHEVRLQFLTEAVVLCCFGGLIGMLLAFGLSVMLAGAIDLPFMFDPGVNIMAFVFSAIMGIIFGYYPAHRASRLDPIDALRHE